MPSIRSIPGGGRRYISCPISCPAEQWTYIVPTNPWNKDQHKGHVHARARAHAYTHEPYIKSTTVTKDKEAKKKGGGDSDKEGNARTTAEIRANNRDRKCVVLQVVCCVLHLEGAWPLSLVCCVHVVYQVRGRSLRSVYPCMKGLNICLGVSRLVELDNTRQCVRCMFRRATLHFSWDATVFCGFVCYCYLPRSSYDPLSLCLSELS